MPPADATYKEKAAQAESNQAPRTGERDDHLQHHHEKRRGEEIPGERSASSIGLDQIGVGAGQQVVPSWCPAPLTIATFRVSVENC